MKNSRALLLSSWFVANNECRNIFSNFCMLFASWKWKWSIKHILLAIKFTNIVFNGKNYHCKWHNNYKIDYKWSNYQRRWVLLLSRKQYLWQCKSKYKIASQKYASILDYVFLLNNFNFLKFIYKFTKAASLLFTLF